MQDIPTREIISSIAVEKTAFSRKILSTSTLDVDLMNKLMKFNVWGIALDGTETWTLRKVDQKYLGSFFLMWCCRRMEKLSWIDRVKYNCPPKP
jgi:hypothetical protein